jgi:serine/threonine protein phosphatase 1
MRVLVVGDIHGCSRALDTLLEAVQPSPEDCVIALGDYIDRGPDSSGVIDRLLDVEKTARLIALRGNHEQMMIDARDDSSAYHAWIECGGKATLASYSAAADVGKLTDVPEAHWDFLEGRCVRCYETATHFFVHANVYFDVPLQEQPDYMLLWEKLGNPLPHISGKIMVCGHTPQRDGAPLNLGHTICLDTWVYGDGWLTCWDIGSGKVWQADQQGALRSGYMDDFLCDELREV